MGCPGDAGEGSEGEEGEEGEAGSSHPPGGPGWGPPWASCPRTLPSSPGSLSVVRITWANVGPPESGLPQGPTNDGDA